MKHIYLHTSNLENARALREDSNFEPTPHYDPIGMANLHRNEFGRIRTKQNYFHILLGKLYEENCPWCGCVPEIKKLGQPGLGEMPIRMDQYCLQCRQCGSRGPILNINASIPEEHIEEYYSMIRMRYVHRRSWDEGFVNPYD